MLSSYEELSVFIRKDEILRVTKACLQRVHLSSTFRHRTLPRTQAPEFVNARVFLAGFLVVYHRNVVFETMGALQTALVEAVVPLMERFQLIIDAVREKRFISEIPDELTQDFPTLLFEYLRRFQVSHLLLSSLLGYVAFAFVFSTRVAD